MHPAKHLIRRAFDRAATTYDRAAEVQRYACRQLAAGLTNRLQPKSILDGGCGTGFGWRLLAERFPDARLVGLDLAPSMLAHARPPTGIVGDLEQLPLASASVDLYWSSLTAQWCTLSRLMPEAVRVLRPGGHLAIATLGPATFTELAAAFAAGDDYVHTLAFPPVTTLLQYLKASGFREVVWQTELLTTHHVDLRTLLRSVKAIGANQLGSGRRRGLMTRATLARAESAYENQRQPAGLPLSYDLVTLHAKK